MYYSGELISIIIQMYYSGGIAGMSSSRQTESSTTITSLTRLDVRSLLVGASSHSVKSTINVERLEDEILDSLPPRPDESSIIRGGGSSTPVPDGSPLDYIKVDEQIDMDVANGQAVLTARVRSEKIVPIVGTKEMFKRSSVIITKVIKVDLTVTPQRKSLYELIVRRTSEAGSLNNGFAVRPTPNAMPGLTKEETSELYRVFMALAEQDSIVAT